MIVFPTDNMAGKILLILVMVLCTALILFTACGDPYAKFCELVSTSDQARTQKEIDKYYEELEAVAPSEIKADVTTLREHWADINMPLGGGKYSRPDKVSKAASDVMNFTEKHCGKKCGVYVIFPELGLK